MGLIFYLPENVSLETAYEKWCEQERALHPEGTRLTYLKAKKELLKKPTKLKQILKKCERATTIVVWNMNQLGSIEDFDQLLAVRRFDSVLVRVLNPNLNLDPQKKETAEMLKAFSSLQKSNVKHSSEEKISAQAFGTPAVSEIIVKAMRRAKREGLKVKQISDKFSYSIPTVIKYTKDIKAKDEPIIIHEKILFDARTARLPVNENHPIHKYLVRFLEHQRTELTQETYYYDLKKTFEWFNEKYGEFPHPSFFVEENLFEFMRYLKKSGSKNNMILRRFNTLSSFLNFCVKRCIIDSNPVKLLKLPKKSSYTVEAEGLEEEEIKLILDRALNEYKAVHTAKRKAVSFRNLLSLYLLSSCGIRVGALCDLRKRDVKTRNGVTYINLQAKKREDTYLLSVDPGTANLLNQYLQTYFDDCSPDEYIFFSRTAKSGKKMTRQDVNRLIGRLCEELNITDRKITAHSFRVSYSCLAIKKGKMSLRELQKRLGHKDIKQTSAYIKLSEGEATAPWMPEINLENPLKEGLNDVN